MIFHWENNGIISGDLTAGFPVWRSPSDRWQEGLLGRTRQTGTVRRWESVLRRIFYWCNASSSPLVRKNEQWT